MMCSSLREKARRAGAAESTRFSPRQTVTHHSTSHENADKRQKLMDVDNWYAQQVVRTLTANEPHAKLLVSICQMMGPTTNGVGDINPDSGPLTKLA